MSKDLNASESNETLDRRMFTHENTPPPVSIEDGSLRVLVPHDKPLTETRPARFIYTGDLTPAGDSNEIAHLKVLHGSGDIIYKNSSAVGSWIKLELQKDNNNPAGDIKIKGGSSFSVDSDSRLGHSGGGANGKHKYDHPGGGASKFRVKAIKVTKGDPDTPGVPILFQVDLGDASGTFKSEEYRILIWLH